MIRPILLAAGRSKRFGADKLLHPLADGVPIGLAAARRMRDATGDVLVVVRAGADELAALLLEEQFDLRVCPRAGEGMGASLAFGVSESRDADGWLVALADMPFVRADTVTAVARLVEEGADIAAPHCRGRRGHPVGFSCRLGGELAQLRGDAGARHLLASHAARLVLHACDDPGCLHDIDFPADLTQASPAS